MYRWVEHTAEVELAIEAASEREVLVDAVEALGELLGFAGSSPTDSRQVLASAPDRAALLAAWLEELVYLAERDGFVPLAVDRLSFGEWAVNATVVGVVDEPPPLIKAVTYHRLAFEPTDSGYLANVVLDV